MRSYFFLHFVLTVQAFTTGHPARPQLSVSPMRFHLHLFLPLCIFVALCASFLPACAGQKREPTHAFFAKICHGDRQDDAVCETVASHDDAPSDTAAYQWFTTSDGDLAILPAHGTSWKFTPEFVFENTPDAALERALDAVRTNDADRFCPDFREPSHCVDQFKKNASYLHEAYLQQPHPIPWIRQGDAYTVTIEDLLFVFMPDDAHTQKTWHLVSLCTSNPALVPDFDPCK